MKNLPNSFGLWGQTHFCSHLERCLAAVDAMNYRGEEW